LNLAPLAIDQPLSVEFQPPPATPAGSSVAAQPALYEAWQAAAEKAMGTYLRAQRILIEAFVAGREHAPAEPPRSLRPPLRDPENVVIGPALLEAGGWGAAASARLRVDEHHPYFFDHPLDHVPGILILEGILQLLETALPEGHFVCGIRLQFKQFCEKTSPTLIRLRAEPAGGHRYAVQVTQDGVEAAHCEAEIAPQPAARQATVPAPRSAKPRPDPRYVHKFDAENVLITELEDTVPGVRCACDLLPPPGGHVLNEGGVDSWPLLYVFEATRQFVMMVAHLREEVPLDMPMNLVSIRLRLDQPAPRGEFLHFECARQPVKRIGRMIMADIAVELHAPWGRIGESSIQAQVVDEETYRRQRGFAVRKKEDGA
jgi:A-factor biosynthesis hotdog domain